MARHTMKGEMKVEVICESCGRNYGYRRPLIVGTGKEISYINPNIPTEAGNKTVDQTMLVEEYAKQIEKARFRTDYGFQRCYDCRYMQSWMIDSAKRARASQVATLIGLLVAGLLIFGELRMAAKGLRDEGVTLWSLAALGLGLLMLVLVVIQREFKGRFLIFFKRKASDEEQIFKRIYYVGILIAILSQLTIIRVTFDDVGITIVDLVKVIAYFVVISILSVWVTYRLVQRFFEPNLALPNSNRKNVPTVTFNPDPSEDYTALGIKQGKRNDNRPALQSFATAIKFNPLNANAYKERAMVFHKMDNASQAIQNLRTYLDLIDGESDTEAQNLLDTLEKDHKVSHRKTFRQRHQQQLSGNDEENVLPLPVLLGIMGIVAVLVWLFFTKDSLDRAILSFVIPLTIGGLVAVAAEFLLFTTTPSSQTRIGWSGLSVVIAFAVFGFSETIDQTVVEWAGFSSIAAEARPVCEASTGEAEVNSIRRRLGKLWIYGSLTAERLSFEDNEAQSIDELETLICIDEIRNNRWKIKVIDWDSKTLLATTEFSGINDLDSISVSNWLSSLEE